MDRQSSFADAIKLVLIERVPAYANRFFYSLGFLSMTSFFLLLVSGIVLAANGPDWWLTSPAGVYWRSVHLWSTQAFVVFILLHLMVVLLTGGYRAPRQLTWVFGALMFFFVLAEAEFGYVLRDDFSSQWRSLQGADLYNGSGLGRWIDTLNSRQIYGIHIVVIPLLILGLLGLHYLLVRVRGIAQPYRKDATVRAVRADHPRLFGRGLLLISVVGVLAWLFPSPFLKPVTIREVATTAPNVLGGTLLAEFERTSDTVTYRDSIDPYQFDTQAVYIQAPFAALRRADPRIPDSLTQFQAGTLSQQSAWQNAADQAYVKANARLPLANDNPLIETMNQLVAMAQSGLYEASLASLTSGGDTTTTTRRLLADTGVLDSQAEALRLTTEQYGMLHDEPGRFPVGAWWLAPIGWLDHTILANDANQDRDGAVILGLTLLVFVAFPYIPGLNVLPDRLNLAKFFWRAETK